MASGSSHVQLGKSTGPSTCKLSAKETGKPPAINSLRHQLLPHTLSKTPTAAAITKAHTGNQPWVFKSRNKIQLAPQDKSAGAGQGGALRQPLVAVGSGVLNTA